MNVSSLSSCSRAPETLPRNRFKGFKEDFQKLQAALKSGDLKAAQDAYAKLKQDLPGSSNSSKNTGTQLGKDLDSIGSALQSGDLSGAQKAFASLQQDIQSARAHHHHNHHDQDGDADDSASTTASVIPASSPTTFDAQA